MKKQANVTDTEQRILDAAEREFISKGFAGSRTTSIAEAANVTHAMLHYYFRTKERLFERILSEKIRLLKEALTVSLTGAEESLRDVLERVIDVHLDFLAANPDLPRFLVSEIIGNPDRRAMLSERIGLYAPMVKARLQSLLDLEAWAGHIRPTDASTLMLDIVSLNVFPFLTMPLVNAILDNEMADMKSFVEARKKNNLETIMLKLRP